ncbi:MAG: sodium:alanine symporter family protein [Planctomycetes bacterium]|nr:sodium:alanine symporter family protein [Planctomycetota bacterium]
MHLLADTEGLSETLSQAAEDLGNLIWGWPLFLLLLGCGILFSVLTKFVQFRVLTHGVAVIRGKYDKPEDAGQINHFQALCTALSATIGLGNIAGVATAVTIGGPGAVFWMWVVGFFGMAIKFFECGLATMFRDEKDVPDPGAPALIEKDIESHQLEYSGQPHKGAEKKPTARGEVSGGPMWYVQKGLAEPAKARGQHGRYAMFRGLAILFAAVTFVASFGGGNSYQSWNVANLLDSQWQIPRHWTGIVAAVMVAMVIIGGIKRIGGVAGRLVPFMCLIYVTGALYIIGSNFAEVPRMLWLIVESAFGPAQAGGAFVGSTIVVAFHQGLRRGLFSNEAGQGSAAIAHATAKTDEPVREGVVAGIGPFIDTIVVCTMTALVILFSGIYNRPALGTVQGMDDARIYVSVNPDVSEKLRRVYQSEIRQDAVRRRGKELDIWVTTDQLVGKEPERASVRIQAIGGAPSENWLGSTEIILDASSIDLPAGVELSDIKVGFPVHLRLDGADLTRLAFDTGIFGFGKYMVTLGVILFAFSTMISWSYYGEKGAEFLFGPKFVLPYKFMFVSVIFLGCVIKEFKVVYNMGDVLTGAMVFVNLPAVLLLLPTYRRAAADYFKRLDRGEMPRKP